MGADGFVVTSAHMKALLETYGVAPSSIRVVPNFLRRPLAMVQREGVRSPAVIGSMGRLMSDKGFDVLLRALSELKAQGIDFQARIGGDGVDMAALRRQASDLNIDDVVEFPGWIANEQKAEFLATLDIFVCPSRYEPFGIVMLEAMEAGLPLVASETTGSAEIIEDGHTGIRVPNEDHLAMAAALKRLIDDPQEARRMAMAAAGQLKDRFHISSAGKLLAAEIAELEAHFETHQKNQAR
jgi:glycosyltransferase involved in cell wall biosynthesis